MTPDWVQPGVWLASAVSLFGGLVSLMAFAQLRDQRYLAFAWVSGWIFAYDLVSLVVTQMDPYQESLLLIRARTLLQPLLGYSLMVFMEAFRRPPLRAWAPVFQAFVGASLLLALLDPGDLFFAPGLPARHAGTPFFTGYVVLRDLLTVAVGLILFVGLWRREPERVPLYSVGGLALLVAMVWDDGLLLGAWTGPCLSEFSFLVLQAAMAAALLRRHLAMRRAAAANDVRISSILEALPDDAAILDIQARQVVSLRLSGVPSAGADGRAQPVETLFPADALADVRATVLKTALTGMGQTIEYRTESDAGSRWFEARTGVMLAPGSERRVDGVVWIGREMTARKRDELAMDAEQAQAERLFRESPGAVMLTEADGAVAQANNGASRLFGVPLESGSPAVRVSDLAARESRMAMDNAWARLRAGESVDEVFLFQRTGGGVCDGELRAAPVSGRSRPLMVLAIWDVTEEARQGARAIQAARMQAQQRLAGILAPVFASALEEVQAALNALDARFPPESEAGVCLDVIRKSAARGTELARRLTAFGRRSRLTMASFELGAWLDGLRDLFRRAVPKTVRLTVDPSPVAVWIRGDAEAVREAVVSAASGIAPAMPFGGEIRIAAERVYLDPEQARTWSDCPGPGWYGVVRLSDTGPRLMPEARSRLFEAYSPFVAPEARAAFHLPMAFGVAAAHGGFAAATVDPGGQNVLRLYFPEQRPEPSPATGSA